MSVFQDLALGLFIGLVLDFVVLVSRTVFLQTWTVFLRRLLRVLFLLYKILQKYALASDNIKSLIQLGIQLGL